MHPGLRRGPLIPGGRGSGFFHPRQPVESRTEGAPTGLRAAPQTKLKTGKRPACLYLFAAAQRICMAFGTGNFRHIDKI